MNMISEGELKGKHNEEIQQLHRELEEKESSLREYRKEHGKLEVFFNRVINHVGPVTPLKSVLKQIQKNCNNKTDTPVIPVMQITDSHMGAVQEADEIEHFNEFSPEIYVRRNLGFCKSFIEWVTLHRNAYNIKECHVIFTGDLISGDIHDELRTTNAFPAPEQVVRAATVHAKQIALLAPFFEKVTVEFLTEDNHSRLTKKPQA